MATVSEFEKAAFIQALRHEPDLSKTMRLLEETPDEVLGSKCPLSGATALFYAVQRPSDIEALQLVDYMCNDRRVCQATAVDVNKQTPLFFAARDGNLKCAQFLLESRCEVNQCDNVAQQTALFYAAREGHLNVVMLLLKEGAEINRLDHLGQTALFYAARDGRIETARYMLEMGADPSVRDKHRKTASSYAQKQGHKDLAGLLRLGTGSHVGKHDGTPQPRQGGSMNGDPPAGAAAGAVTGVTTGAAPRSHGGKHGKRHRASTPDALCKEGGADTIRSQTPTGAPLGPPPVPRKKHKLEYRAPFEDEDMWLFATETHVQVFEKLFPKIAIWRKDAPPPAMGKVSTDTFRSEWYKIAASLVHELTDYEGGWVFAKPVDTKQWQCGDYYEVIRKPMDFGTVKKKLKQGSYKYATEMVADVRLIFENCHKYNKPGTQIAVLGRSLESFWENRIIVNKLTLFLEKEEKLLAQQRKMSEHYRLAGIDQPQKSESVQAPIEDGTGHPNESFTSRVDCSSSQEKNGAPDTPQPAKQGNRGESEGENSPRSESSVGAESSKEIGQTDDVGVSLEEVYAMQIESLEPPVCGEPSSISKEVVDDKEREASDNNDGRSSSSSESGEEAPNAGINQFPGEAGQDEPMGVDKIEN